ncbi:MAG TPA: hypothetical protein VMX75_11185, partial [Spirochaetia bacterium]|nr:hypothetical protein [Spirochaetia bacterium]
MAVYRDVVAPMLSGRILDIHAHARAEVPSGEYHRMQHKYPGRKLEPFPVEELLATAQLMWPGQSYHALVFGMPMPEMREASNAHVA